ncbi:permease [Acinetobacter pseudolwoffii]|uniref:permease n=1 Tax=Acinetobacter pseudolwoffii TaxID=2053287 RepID=UPI0025771F9E|nr:permease [Acinetobacter pseudolwoffii]MDM1336450.1 permease [Acinetobacter pseudolwoffii]
MESIIAIFAWLNDVLLKMTWLSEGVRWLVENVFGLSVVTRLGGSIHFFIYDVFKIFILLSVLIYVVLGLILAVIGGSLISFFKMEKYVAKFVTQNSTAQGDEDFKMSAKECREFAWEQVVEIFSKVWMYVLIGVGIGAAIHNWIPEQWITALLGQDHWYSVLIATIIGIPMYADIFGTLPIAEALVVKGVGLGTVLAFMMAVTALSLPSLILLKQVVKTRLLSLFIGIVFVGILIIGYSLNTLGDWFL